MRIRQLVLVAEDRDKVVNDLCDLFKIKVLVMFIILGSSFAHRTVTPFLFLGVILVVFKHKYVNLNDYNLRNNSLAYPSKAEESAS